MPRTELLQDNTNTSSFEHPIFKQRLSSRGRGVTWDEKLITPPRQNWIIQESITIDQELRIYLIGGQVYPVGAIRQSKTALQATEAIDSRQLTQDEIDFASKVSQLTPNLDIAGIDIARTSAGDLYLVEVNRSPGFAKFYDLTGVNLAEKLYANIR